MSAALWFGGGVLFGGVLVFWFMARAFEYMAKMNEVTVRLFATKIGVEIPSLDKRGVAITPNAAPESGDPLVERGRERTGAA